MQSQGNGVALVAGKARCIRAASLCKILLANAATPQFQAQFGPCAAAAQEGGEEEDLTQPPPS